MGDGRSGNQKGMDMVLDICRSITHSDWIRPLVGSSHRYSNIRRVSVGGSAARQE
jgi:hypothetical protein